MRGTRKGQVMRALTQQERAAMCLYHERYARQDGGAIDFYAALSASDKRIVQQMLDDLCPTKAPR